MKAGFIGLGTMGAHMAANLQKGIQKDGHTVIEMSDAIRGGNNDRAKILGRGCARGKLGGFCARTICAEQALGSSGHCRGKC